MRAVTLTALVLLAAGCGDSSSTVRIEIGLAPQAPAPSALTLSIFDRTHALLVRHPIGPPVTLPGALFVTHLPSENQHLGLVVAGDPSAELGTAEVETIAGGEVDTIVVLALGVLDSDGDGVPDSIDDCPGAANPEQLDQNGDGIGDACAGGFDAARLVDATVLADAPMAIDAAQPIDAASPIDAAIAVDALPDLSRSLACTAQLCQSFEAPVGIPWTVTTVGGTATADNTHAADGVTSYHLVEATQTFDGGPPTYVGAWLDESMTFQANPQTTYVRFYYWHDQKLPTKDLTYLFDNNGQTISLYESNGMLSLYSDLGGAGLQGGVPVPLGQWNCMEWAISFGDPGTMSGSLNGNVVVGPWNIKTLGSSAPKFLRIGLYDDYGGNDIEGGDAWIDRIAIDTKPIGCN